MVAVQCAVHMVTARFGCERAMVGTRWNISHLDCMNIWYTICNKTPDLQDVL